MKIDKTWYIKPTDNFPVRITAGGVVVRKVEKKIFIALIRDTNFNDYMLPKGGIEKGEDSLTAAKREIGEETGLTNINYVSKLGIKERLGIEKKNWSITHYFLFNTNQVGGKQKLQSGEKDLVASWFDVDNLPHFFWPEQKEVIEENLEKIKRAI